MPGSTSRRDHQEDPRDNTVDLPRIDVDGLTDYFRRAAPMLEPEPAGLLEPLPEQEPAGPIAPRRSDLLHPYADPDEPQPSASRPVAQAAPAPDAEPTSASSTRRPSAEPDTNQAPTAGDAEPSGLMPAPSRAVADPVPAAPTYAGSDDAPAPVSRVEPTKPGTQPIMAMPDAGAPDRASRDRRLGGRAPAGSLADLRSRLARLPDGHPSSPYEDGGHARPGPIRLRQLELGLPAASREPAAGVAPDSEAAADKQVVPPDSAQREPTAALAVGEPADDAKAQATRLSESRPTTPERADPDSASSNGHLERSSAGADPQADLTLAPWRGTPPRRVSGLEGLSPRGSNGHGPANGHRNGSRSREDPVEPDRVERPPTETDRPDTAEYRVPELPAGDLRELVERTLTTSRTAEGRNVFGSYGSSGLTPMMQRVAANLPFGGLAPDSETNSLKSADRLAAKLGRLVVRNPGRTAEELAATIGDVVRYAFAFEAADYVEGTWLVHRRLKSHGFDLELRRNRWESPEYKGIFTQWRDPAHHIAFEVQFHTTASWSVVQRTHEAYIQITDPATSPADRARLRARQVAAAAAAKAPPNWADLADFRLEAR